MARVYLGLGSNLADRRETLRDAVIQLREYSERATVSSLYETEPVGYTDQPSFLNAVAVLETDLSPRTLLDGILGIERELGRVRTFKNAPRTIDIDMLFYDEQVSNEPELTLPHPRLHERAFVLVPLTEVAPDLDHPILKRTMSELLGDLNDELSSIRRVAGPEWAD